MNFGIDTKIVVLAFGLVTVTAACQERTGSPRSRDSGSNPDVYIHGPALGSAVAERPNLLADANRDSHGPRKGRRRRQRRIQVQL